MYNNNGWSFGKIVLTIIALYLGYRVGVWALGQVLGLIVPVAVLGGIVYLVYRVTGGKALGGGRKTLP